MDEAAVNDEAEAAVNNESMDEGAADETAMGGPAIDGVTAEREVIVGLDPRYPSRAAVSWAAEEARLRRLPLRLVVAVPWLGGTRHRDDEPQRPSLRAQATQVLESAAGWAGGDNPPPELIMEVYDGSPVAGLTAGSRHAQSVVVGSHGLNRLKELLSAGSVVAPLTARARCPVVVVREPLSARAGPPHLVVGVDADSPSTAAIGFAFAEAAVRGVALSAVSVREPPLLPFTHRERARERQRGLLAEAVAGWSGRHPGVAVAQEVLVGDPVEELVGASSTALAVVVGRSHRHLGTGIGLGRVVHGLLHRASCPVIVVPPP
ncbi:universal stress protein [Streptomyces wuyuanensis]|uniref:Nucleotide-binding universal stress protein, UspA family n=1 Tax=Streptomyces wuyuanensis TaxID=1196353 RepID=A0A1G9PVP3_9ACTN|nr:universal stress protein [Streptomyces wuyuanensis]SDM02830.1 Nucleotide-binding universal stress protein, UspA family [Streptomyces wuyuanensis]